MLKTGRHFLTDRYTLQVTCPQALAPQSGKLKLMPDVSSNNLFSPGFDSLDAMQLLTNVQ